MTTTPEAAAGDPIELMQRLGVELKRTITRMARVPLSDPTAIYLELVETVMPLVADVLSATLSEHLATRQYILEEVEPFLDEAEAGAGGIAPEDADVLTERLAALRAMLVGAKESGADAAAMNDEIAKTDEAIALVAELAAPPEEEEDGKGEGDDEPSLNN